MSDEIEEYFNARLGQYLREHSDDGIAVASVENPGAMDRAEIGVIRDVQAIIYHWRYGGMACESPIEKRLYAALLFIDDGFETISFCDFALKYPPASGTYVFPQHKIGKYTVDFALIHFHDGRPAFTIVIECDGHDYHERTKEQARHDKSRDRAIAAVGITVLRFTGSEIYRSATDCCAEISDILKRKVAEFGAASTRDLVPA